MKTNQELVTTLRYLLAHIEAGPADAGEWADIAAKLDAANKYARKAVKVLALTEGLTSAVKPVAPVHETPAAKAAGK